MPDEAKLIDDGNGLYPEGPGWFIVNTRDAQWAGNETNGRYVSFESAAARWETLGFGFHVLDPGQTMGKYHAESNHEAFVVLSGRATLLVEGEKRELGPWDMFNCVPDTEHILIGAGDGPCAIVCVGVRDPNGTIRYPATELARRYGAAAPHDTDSPAEAYKDVERPAPRPYRSGDLPGL